MPIGRAPARFDCRPVIIATFVGTLVSSGAIAVATVIGAVPLALGALFGGMSFALYALCAAHTNGRLSPDDRVGAGGGLARISQRVLTARFASGERINPGSCR